MVDNINLRGRLIPRVTLSLSRTITQKGIPPQAAAPLGPRNEILYFS